MPNHRAAGALEMVTPVDERNGFTIRHDHEGELDEVFLTSGCVHLERMNTGAWWIGFIADDGTRLRVWLGAKNESRTVVKGWAHWDGKDDPLRALADGRGEG